jgi:hypothetical protein
MWLGWHVRGLVGARHAREIEIRKSKIHVARVAASYTPASINHVSTTVSGFSDMLSMP